MKSTNCRANLKEGLVWVPVFEFMDASTSILTNDSAAFCKLIDCVGRHKEWKFQGESAWKDDLNPAFFLDFVALLKDKWRTVNTER